MTVHPTAVVDRTAFLGPRVVVGPYAVVGAHAVVGEGTILSSHVYVGEHAILGAQCELFPFSAVGAPAQTRDREKRGGNVKLGARNVLREHVTVHAGTVGGATILGEDNLLMVGSHVGHDVHLGSSCVLSNGVQLAGHVRVGDFATFGGLAGVAQNVVVGESAFVAAGARVERDVPSMLIVQGDRARIRGVNRVGLRRRGIPEQDLEEIFRIYRKVFLGKQPKALALSQVAAETPWGIRFLRGLVP